MSALRRRLALALRPVLLAAAGLPLAPASAWAASEGGGSVFWEYFNLLLMVGVLVYLARKPVLNYLAERRAGIQSDLAATEELLSQAESRLAEWSAKASRLDADIDEVRRISRRRAEDERVRILEDATRSAERIRKEAKSAVEREVQRARGVLRQEAADLALELAGSLLSQQVTDDDRQRLVDEFVTRVEQGAGSSASGGA